jgi:tRNA-dihydrouridine synthase B
MRKLRIGNVEIKGYAALAPMAGVADTAFRLICKEFGAAYVVGEMASSKALCMSDKKTKTLLQVTEQEHPMAVQIFGYEPHIMAEAAKKAAEFCADIIDINMGCPAPKVAGNGGGSALMNNPALAGRIIEAVVKAVNCPVTVKIRKGWNNKNVNAVELARIAEQYGAAAITVHGRTTEQMYAPPIDLDIIAQVKRAVNIPVIGNGDVNTPEAAKKMYDYTGCDLVMVGRGALGAPWLFAQTTQYLLSGEYSSKPPVLQRMDIMLHHIKLICELKGEYTGMREARKHAAWYMKGIDNAAAYRRETGSLTTYGDILRLAERIKNQQLSEL